MDDPRTPRRSSIYTIPLSVTFAPAHLRRRSRWLGRVFVQGLAAVMPLVITIYLLWWLGGTFESLLGGGLKRALPEGRYWPGMGLTLGLALIFALGVFLQLVMARHLYAGFEEVLKRVPIVRTIYGPLKDMTALFSTDTKERANAQRAVRVDLPALGFSLVGFVTREDAMALTSQEDDAERIAVYLPMSYQIGGYMLLLPRSAVRPLDIGVQDVLKMTLTAGLAMGDTETAHAPAATPPAATSAAAASAKHRSAN